MNFCGKILIYAICTAGLYLCSACSNTKNTAATRSFHNVTSKYNVLFEAQQFYESGIRAVNSGLNVDYTDILPIYKIDAPESPSLAVSYMDACVEECGKNVLKHSITAKPRKKYSHGGMSESDQQFFNKPEFCKWIDDTYLLMGKANYAAGDLDRAESSLQLCVTRFRHEPSKFEAQLWLAKTFWAQKNYLESVDLLDKLSKDVRHPKKLNADIQKVYAQNDISNKRYAEAIKHLEKALDLTKRKQEKAWLIYILGDLYRMVGNYSKSRVCYERVVKMRTDNTMVFNAKINLAIVFTPGDNIEKIRTQLEKLAQDPNNEPYRDQIYYALAELEMRNSNVNQALTNYIKSARYSSTNNTQKAKSYIAAADIYFDKNDYINAGIFYDSAMTYLPKTYSDYESISQKTSNLSELIKYIRAAEYQDSLQRVALMPEAERNRLISNIIINVVNKEEEEKLRQSQPYYSSRDNNYGVEYTGQDGNPGFSGKWYLYNQTALNYGRGEFLKKWGTRPLEDNWRRKNKGISTNSQEEDDEEEQNSDSTITNKMSEYYLQNLPLTDSAMKICVDKEAEAWFAAAGVYEEKIGDIDKAVETLLYINQQHPNHYLMPQSLYQLVKLYNKKAEYPLADYTKQQLISQYPNTGYAKILQDPNYINTISARKNVALAFYDEVVENFANKNYYKCVELCKKGQTEYSNLQLVENFIYMEARSYGNLGNTNLMKQRLEFLLEKYPNSSLAKSARLKLEALNTGEFETSQFKFAPELPHYFVIIANVNNPKTNSVNFMITKYCSDGGYSQADISELDINSEIYKVFVMSQIDNKDNAVKFLKGFDSEYQSQLQPTDDFRIMLVDSNSFSKIVDEASLESYYNFYISNY